MPNTVDIPNADALASIEATMTAEEKQAYAESIERARAQFGAGEAVPGERVIEWLASWGTENELPAPTRGDRD